MSTCCAFFSLIILKAQYSTVPRLVKGLIVHADDRLRKTFTSSPENHEHEQACMWMCKLCAGLALVVFAWEIHSFHDGITRRASRVISNRR